MYMKACLVSVFTFVNRDIITRKYVEPLVMITAFIYFKQREHSVSPLFSDLTENMGTVKKSDLIAKLCLFGTCKCALRHKKKPVDKLPKALRNTQKSRFDLEANSDKLIFEKVVFVGNRVISHYSYA